jgi:two-component system sensor histidine kinase MprB
MSSGQIAIAAASAVALAVITASAVVYVVARGQLRAPIDEALERRAAEITAHPLTLLEDPDGDVYLGVRPEFGEAGGYVQLVKADGALILPPRQALELPINDDVLDIAGARGETAWSETTVDGEHRRVFTFAYGPDSAVQVARPLTEVDQSLEQLGLLLLLIATIGVAGSGPRPRGVAGGARAGAASRTPRRETKTRSPSESTSVDATSSAARGELQQRSPPEESTRAQRQLVADASHELRTPLTSLRTNIEVLADDRALPPQERGRLLSDVVEQLGEMTTLISELIELARAEEQTLEPEDVRLDLAASEALERARRNHPEISFSSTLDESVVHGVSSTIERAIGNLLDNAAKWSQAGGEVELQVADGTVTVRDHGPGIGEEDLPYVFDRFYRARAARGMPGSGLGLAIVRQVAEATARGRRERAGGDPITLSSTGPRTFPPTP